MDNYFRHNTTVYDDLAKIIDVKKEELQIYSVDWIMDSL